MFRIRRIHDDLHPQNREALAAVERMLRSQFPGIRDDEVAGIRAQLLNPFAKRFKTILYVAENARGSVLGFAVLMHDPVADFSYLDLLAADRTLRTRGIGGALYQRVREEAVELGKNGLFFECLPDIEGTTSTPELLRQNRARLRFYEQFGARPIIDTDYERPLRPGELDMPSLVYDDLDRGTPLRRSVARKVVRAVLERKYAGLCPPEYVDAVVSSIKADPVRIRPPRYTKAARATQPLAANPILLVVNDKHQIHHVRDRGYVEAPVRIRAILRDLDPTGYFKRIPAKDFPERHITAVHDPALVKYLARVCKGVPPEKSIYPYVFPIRNPSRPPKDLGMQAGYYCIDTFTPLNESAYLAAREAVNCALTAADAVAGGARFAYALVRPPGHHAERSLFGGFCYFNNNAIAAQRLSALGRVAILDVDYHHGNGQQDIFYRRSDVLTVSIHGHPSFAYPYFSGHEDERGEGDGEGYNYNFPLPEARNGARYRETLAKALKKVAAFKPDFLVLALGFDTGRGDPTGSWSLTAEDFEANGRLIADLKLPTLVVQEGGYRTRTLGANARRFFTGLTYQNYPRGRAASGAVDVGAPPTIRAHRR
jgi:acetoin utilization deacetylase AcuC-like enzyme/GNAT superfamily N-acetyltransferase